MKFLHPYAKPPANITIDEVVYAFFNWSEFDDIRCASIANIGAEATERDLIRLWGKYLNYERQSIAPHLFIAVKAAISRIGRFSRRELAPLVPEVQSTRQLQRILEALAKVGLLRKKGSKRGTRWETVVEAAAKSGEEELCAIHELKQKGEEDMGGRSAAGKPVGVEDVIEALQTDPKIPSMPECPNYHLMGPMVG